MTRRRREDETQELLPAIAGTVPQREEEVTIDLMELLTQILDHWLLVVICAMIGTAVMGFYSFRIATPLYKSPLSCMWSTARIPQSTCRICRSAPIWPRTIRKSFTTGMCRIRCWKNLD